ncbi:MAG TPA: histidine--tRNA ligase [bacterium]|nr:histidine--tRNA ligase [bacterium]
MADNSKFVPPKGMRDWLPQETLLRQKLIRLIESYYQLYGFQPIDTPVMENIEVLQGKGGGENEKLMFKVMKRGQEFSDVVQNGVRVTESQSMDDNEFKSEVTITKQDGPLSVGQITKAFSENMSDMGLRFDMTVPLARYYGNHANDLPKPFRCYHIGPVWRADRPQKGRFREFYQCDIDIIGSTSENYEVELLLATDRVLKALNIGNFKIRISHKQLLPALLTGLGVSEAGVAGIALAIDKLDKQPLEQVWKEIESLGHSLEVLAKVDGFLKDALHKKLDLGQMKIAPAEALWAQIDSIRQKVHEVNSEANVVFDPLLVRGFDYYTGPVFEINVEDKDFAFSIGGGGRYDGLIEKLGGPKNTPAVGLSLGFERILTILMERGGISKALQSRVYIVNDKHSEKDIQVLAESLRAHGIAVETGLEKKDKVKQLVAAQGSGLEYAITDFVPGAETFKVRQLSNRQDTEMNAEQLKTALSNLDNSGSK